MSVSSQDEFSCKWAWCRLTFPDNEGLNQHVVHDHVRLAIPVRRRDISMIKRAEEGKGESFKISELMVDMYSYTSRESISHKPVEHPQEPSSSSLPSPASSQALRSPHHLVHSPGPVMSRPSQLRLDPSAVPLSPPSPDSSPTFAVSTPSRQNWYQPPLKRRKKSTCNDKDSGPLQITPGPSTEESQGKHAIADALPANDQNDLATRLHSPCDLFSQTSQDSSDLSQITSYPALQTQAPYQSQILTQF